MKICVFDTETTGLDHKNDDVIEFGACVIDENGEVLEDYNTLIKTNINMSDEVIRIHGITHGMLDRYGKHKSEVVPKILSLLQDCDYWCGHNLRFDVNFCKSNFGVKDEKPILDTLKIARRFYPTSGFRHKSLGAMCKSMSIPLDKAHRAYEDALATSSLLFSLLKDLDLTIEEALSDDLVTIGPYCIGMDPFDAIFVAKPYKR